MAACIAASMLGWGPRFSSQHCLLLYVNLKKISGPCGPQGFVYDHMGLRSPRPDRFYPVNQGFSKQGPQNKSINVFPSRREINSRVLPYICWIRNSGSRAQESVSITAPHPKWLCVLGLRTTDLDQRFSTNVILLPSSPQPWKQLTTSGDIFNCHNEGRRGVLLSVIQWAGARDAADHLAMRRTAATIRIIQPKASVMLR